MSDFDFAWPSDARFQAFPGEPADRPVVIWPNLVSALGSF
jgi:hypothetical protein